MTVVCDADEVVGCTDSKHVITIKMQRIQLSVSLLQMHVILFGEQDGTDCLDNDADDDGVCDDLKLWMYVKSLDNYDSMQPMRRM